MSGDLKIFSNVRLTTPGVYREIVAAGTSIRIDILRDGRPPHGYCFHHLQDRALLADALSYARRTQSQTLRFIGKITLASGAEIEVGACFGKIAIRWHLPREAGADVKRATFLQGTELEALEKAYAHVLGVIEAREARIAS